MKLTKQQLKQIIKEELNNLHEGQFDDTVTRQADRRKSEAAQGHETLRVLLTDFDPASANLTWEDYDSLKKLLWWLDNGDTDLAKPEQQETEVTTGIESDDDSDRLHLQTPSETDMRRLQRTGAGTVPRYRPTGASE